ncbi:MAG: DUF1015 family protein [Candidatus Dormibacteria bacterium]
MARVSPFRGLRFNPALVDLGSVLSPPYDVIGPELQAELYGRALQNVVRLELGRDYPDDRAGERDRYTRAHEHLRAWLEEGVLVQDDAPSIYVHEHRFPAPDGTVGTRLGCFVAVQPVGYDRREVLRHELTLSGPRQDRVRLLEATGVQTSAVMLLYEGASEVTEELRRLAAQAQPTDHATVPGESGPEHHRLWRLSDPARLEAICQALGASRLFIADGHHRYETALSLGLPGVLSLMAPLDDPGNLILPTHRVLPQSTRNLMELATGLLGVGWEVERRQRPLSQTLEEIARRRAAQHAFGIGDGEATVVAARPRTGEGIRSPRAQLDVAVLGTEILGAHLGIAAADASAGRLLYLRSAQEALRQAAAHRGLAFLLNPTTVAEMAAVASAGEAMPQKSTYFFPKVPAGLVLLPGGGPAPVIV